MLRIGLLALSLLISGCASPGITGSIANKSGEAFEPIAATHETTECIQLHRVRSTRVIDRTGIAYEMPDRKVWLNRPKWGASMLNRYLVMVTRGDQGRLCSGDVVRFVDSSLAGFASTVGLGTFVRYTGGQ